jgi:hypothetical protein
MARVYQLFESEADTSYIPIDSIICYEGNCYRKKEVIEAKLETVVGDDGVTKVYKIVFDEQHNKVNVELSNNEIEQIKIVNVSTFEQAKFNYIPAEEYAMPELSDIAGLITDGFYLTTAGIASSTRSKPSTDYYLVASGIASSVKSKVSTDYYLVAAGIANSVKSKVSTDYYLMVEPIKNYLEGPATDDFYLASKSIPEDTVIEF